VPRNSQLTKTIKNAVKMLCAGLSLSMSMSGFGFGSVFVVTAADKSKRHLNVSTMVTTSAVRELTNLTKHGSAFRHSGIQERIGSVDEAHFQQSVLCCSSGKSSM